MISKKKKNNDKLNICTNDIFNRQDVVTKTKSISSTRSRDVSLKGEVNYENLNSVINRDNQSITSKNIVYVNVDEPSKEDNSEISQDEPKDIPSNITINNTCTNLSESNIIHPEPILTEREPEISVNPRILESSEKPTICSTPPSVKRTEKIESMALKTSPTYPPPGELWQNNSQIVFSNFTNSIEDDDLLKDLDILINEGRESLKIKKQTKTIVCRSLCCI